jgi:hypothetical protein
VAEAVVAGSSSFAQLKHEAAAIFAAAFFHENEPNHWSRISFRAQSALPILKFRPLQAPAHQDLPPIKIFRT